MKEQLVSFTVAKLAKEKGFNEACLECYIPKGTLYNNNREGVHFTNKQLLSFNYSAPTQSLLHRWLREIHNIDVVIVPERYKNGVNYLVQAQKFDLTSDPETNLNFCIEGSYWFNDNHEYPTYEDAMEKGLEEALKLIK